MTNNPTWQRPTIKAKRLLKLILWKAGIVIRRAHPQDRPTTPEECRMAMIRHNKISVVLDVGANDGQFGGVLRENGYQGKIISFEPLAKPFATLARVSGNDSGWEAHNIALGSESGYCDINVSNMSASSSLLPMLDSHLRIAPQSGYVRKERITVETLDKAVRFENDDIAMLKIDTQGFERQVLEGAAETLKKVSLLECELSLIPLYGGQDLILSMLDFIQANGFRPVSFERVFSDPASGYALQVDGIFCRKD
jgi:FkbM family methyltransferase